MSEFTPPITLGVQDDAPGLELVETTGVRHVERELLLRCDAEIAQQYWSLDPETAYHEMLAYAQETKQQFSGTDSHNSYSRDVSNEFARRLAILVRSVEYYQTIASVPKALKDIIQDLKAKLAIMHEKTITEIAKRTYNGSAVLDADDLRAEGHFGLLQALRKFDPDASTPFGVFALLRIKGSMVDQQRYIGTAVRLPRRVVGVYHNYNEGISQGMTPAEAAEAMGQDPRVILAELGKCAQLAHVHSVEVLQEQNPNVTGRDLATTDASIDAMVINMRELVDNLEVVVQFQNGTLHRKPELDEKYRDILQASYGLPPYKERQPIGEIAARYGVTNSRISQMRRAAQASLRRSLPEELRDITYFSLDEHIIVK